MRYLLAAALFVTLLGASAARADRTDAHACRYDRQRFCFYAQPGHVRACLQKHYKELTSACRKELDGGGKTD
jgi:hypothetical protein